jgi:hypothetical protein
MHPGFSLPGLAFRKFSHREKFSAWELRDVYCDPPESQVRLANALSKQYQRLT